MKYLLILISTLFFISCEEVITLELDTSEQKIIIEANLDATNKTCTVNLSKSGDFYETNNFEKIQGADISINTPDGNSYQLNNFGNGVYKANNIAISPEETIELKIKLSDGQDFYANAIVPNPVTLDNIEFNENSISGPGGGPGGKDGDYNLSVEWKDALEEKNYNRIKIYTNGEYLSGIYVLYDDKIQNGNDVRMPIMRQRFSKGDTVKVELLACSKSYFDYFADIANGEGRGFSSTTPFNPMGNVNNGAIGYFGIWYISEKERVVK